MIEMALMMKKRARILNRGGGGDGAQNVLIRFVAQSRHCIPVR